MYFKNAHVYMTYPCNTSITETRVWLLSFICKYKQNFCVYVNLHTLMLILSMSASQKHAYALELMQICTH